MSVTFGAATASRLTSGIRSWSDTEIVAELPKGATTAPIRLAYYYDPDGPDEEATVITYNLTGPVVTVTELVEPSIFGMSPASAPIGAEVAITGAHLLDACGGKCTLRGIVFGGEHFDFSTHDYYPTVYTDNTLVTTVPKGAKSGQVLLVYATPETWMEVRGPVFTVSAVDREKQIADIRDAARLLKDDRIDAILAELKELRDRVREQEAEIKYLHALTAGLQNVTEALKERVNSFITYGVDNNSKRLGAGERAAVMHSYKTAFGKLPGTEDELGDAIKIANGRWPSERSEQAEARARTQFRRVYLRDADMGNPNDNAAVTVMAYGLRQLAENRNLDSERAGIGIFKGIYRHVPSTTEEWNIMQAITYSGASR